MFSIDECRKLIPDSEQYSDDDIAKIRDDLYSLAHLALDSYSDENKR